MSSRIYLAVLFGRALELSRLPAQMSRYADQTDVATQQWKANIFLWGASDSGLTVFQGTPTGVVSEVGGRYRRPGVRDRRSNRLQSGRWRCRSCLRETLEVFFLLTTMAKH